MWFFSASRIHGLLLHICWKVVTVKIVSLSQQNISIGEILFCNIWFYSCHHFDHSFWVLKMFWVSASVIVKRYCEFLYLYFPLFCLFLTPVCFATGKRDDWCFMCELQSHLWKVRQNHNPFSPIRILSRIRNIGNHLGYGRQEDAHEFMRYANYVGGQCFTWITG